MTDDFRGPLGLWFFPVLNSLLGAKKRTRRERSSRSSGRYVVAVSEDKETISPVFARAPFFLVFENSRKVAEVANPYVEAVPAGPPAVELVSTYHPEYVVAGSFGAIASNALSDRGIQSVTKTGKV